MANQDNQCKDLEIENHLGRLMEVGKNSLCTFDVLYTKQQKMQVNTYKKDFSNKTLDKLVEFLLANKHAMDDEFGEMLDAVGGIHDGIGNAVWKHWKKDNQNTKVMFLENLSERDKKELLFEVADIFAFFLNIPIALGFKSEDVYNALMTKIIENQKRQENGY